MARNLKEGLAMFAEIPKLKQNKVVVRVTFIQGFTTNIIEQVQTIVVTNTHVHLHANLLSSFPAISPGKQLYPCRYIYHATIVQPTVKFFP